MVVIAVIVVVALVVIVAVFYAAACHGLHVSSGWDADSAAPEPRAPQRAQDRDSSQAAPENTNVSFYNNHAAKAELPQTQAGEPAREPARRGIQDVSAEK